LLRSGELEQVASPREIYNRPATSYTAQFIGHTNLLDADVRQGTAICSALKWPTAMPDGAALFSLRPECIRPASTTSATVALPTKSATVRFTAKLRDQAFHGATDLLRVESDGGLILTIRTASRDLPNSEARLEFEFSAADAIPVRATSLASNSEERH
jgi:ABC-type Fe3+/spermidine/putrescine transport system ATPase subunit